MRLLLAVLLLTAGPGAAADPLTVGEGARMAARGGSADVADLPITELPAKGKPSMIAVIYSGDGGWRDLDKRIGERLASAGVPVIGVDSLRYFWREKTPDRVARDLERIIVHYGSAWGTGRVILIGYSFGADILPFAVNRLDRDTRARIVQISLLGLATEADFEIHPLRWLGLAPDRQGRPVLPEITRIDPHLLQCFYGEEEDHTACTDPAFTTAEVVRTAGGHHFDGNYRALAERILAGARVRAGN